MLGESDPDAIISDRLSGDSPFLATEKMDLNEGVQLRYASGRPTDAAAGGAAAAEPRASEGSQDEARRRAESGVDRDRSDRHARPSAAGRRRCGCRCPPPPRSLDQVFRGMRDESSRASSEEAAAEQYRLALTYHEMGMAEDAIKALEAAARSPRQRFDAASMLGRLYLERKDTDPRDRVARTRRRSAGADAGCRPRAAVRPGQDARIGGRALARARGVRRARIRIRRLSRRRRPDRAAVQSAGSRLALFRRLLFVALLLETGLLLVLIPWSAFWERNYFVEWSAAARRACSPATTPAARSPASAWSTSGRRWASWRTSSDRGNPTASEIDPQSEIRNPR